MALIEFIIPLFLIFLGLIIGFTSLVMKFWRRDFIGLMIGASIGPVLNVGLLVWRYFYIYYVLGDNTMIPILLASAIYSLPLVTLSSGIIVGIGWYYFGA